MTFATDIGIGDLLIGPYDVLGMIIDVNHHAHCNEYDIEWLSEHAMWRVKNTTSVHYSTQVDRWRSVYLNVKDSLS